MIFEFLGIVTIFSIMVIIIGIIRARRLLFVRVKHVEESARPIEIGRRRRRQDGGNPT